MTETYEITRRVIPEQPGRGRLGRVVHHDSRSLRYLVQPRRDDSLRTVLHTRRVPVWDQGSTGSCTGHAAAGAVGTNPHGISATQEMALDLYSKATTLDPWEGSWPPSDTGSSGLAVAQAAKSLGLISGYQHATSLLATVTALQDYPVITGVSWYEGFDSPDSAGRVQISGDERGGHEFELLGVDVDAREFWAVNSWGEGYGLSGRFRFSWDTFDRLLHEQGDVTVLLPLTAPAPVPTPAVDHDRVLADSTRTWAKRYQRISKTARAINDWRTAKGL